MPTKQIKLQKNWERPYKIIEIIRTGTYKLEAINGTPIKTLGMLHVFAVSTSKNVLRPFIMINACYLFHLL